MGKVVRLEDKESVQEWTNGPTGSREVHVKIRRKADGHIAEMAYPRRSSLNNTVILFRSIVFGEAERCGAFEPAEPEGKQA
ncbi:MAG: hypothetical protein AAGJ54_05755 [Planctomycetota bacterium]